MNFTINDDDSVNFDKESILAVSTKRFIISTKPLFKGRKGIRVTKSIANSLKTTPLKQRGKLENTQRDSYRYMKPNDSFESTNIIVKKVSDDETQAFITQIDH